MNTLAHYASVIIGDDSDFNAGDDTTTMAIDNSVTTINYKMLLSPKKRACSNSKNRYSKKKRLKTSKNGSNFAVGTMIKVKRRLSA